MQKRYFNWQDDDSTDAINRHLLGILPYGLYAGYDGVLVDGLTLTLNHEATGLSEVTEALAFTPKLGVCRTKQGVVIKEDGPLPIAIVANPSGFGRVDTVIVEHTYVETVGGATAVYKILKGSASASPVPASLPFPERQMELGFLYVPGGMTSLNNAGVVYTRATIPTLGNDGTIMRTDKPQTSLARKQLISVYGSYGKAVVNAGVMTFTKEANYFVLENTGVDYVTVNTVTALFTAETFTRDIMCKQRLKLTTGGNVSINRGVSEMFIEAGEILRLISVEGVSGETKLYHAIKGGEVKNYGFNKLSGEIAGSKGTASIGGGEVALDGFGNFYDFSIAANNLIKWLPQRSTATGNAKLGSCIYVQIKSDGMVTLQHNVSGGASNVKPVFCVTQADMVLKDGDILILLEDDTHWRMVNVIGTGQDSYSLKIALDNLDTNVTASLASLYSQIVALDGELDSAVVALNARIDAINISVLDLAKQYSLKMMWGLEPNIILEGGVVTSVNTGAGTLVIAGGSALINGDFRNFPAYSGTYPVYLEAGPGREIGRWVNAPAVSANSIKYDPYTSQALAHVIKRVSTEDGELRLSTVLTSDFDSSGKGKWKWKGFSLANANNGTVDMVGFVPVGLKDQPYTGVKEDYRYLGTTVGVEKVALSESNLPSHYHFSFHNSKSGSVVSSSNFPLYGDSGSNYLIAGSANTPNVGKTSSVGSGTSHENRQPSRITVFLQRVKAQDND